jgi:hypothetical protein
MLEMPPILLQRQRQRQGVKTRMAILQQLLIWIHRKASLNGIEGLMMMMMIRSLTMQMHSQTTL